MTFTNINGSRLLFFGLFLAIIIAAIAPLTLPFYNIIVYTPYIPFCVIIIMLSLYWLQKPRKIFKRREEYIFITAQVLIVLLAVSHDSSTSLSTSVVALYTIGLFWIARFLLSVRVLNRSNLFFTVKIVLAVLTIIALLQFVLHKNIGMVATYFGENLVQGHYSTTGGTFFRISSTFTNPNIFSQVYTSYASILIAVLLFNNSSPRLFLSIVASGVMTFVVAISLSRSGLLFSILVQMALYRFWISQGGQGKRERHAILIIMSFAVLLIALIGFSFVGADLIPGISRFSEFGIENDINKKRLIVYGGALQLLRDPLVLMFGVGKGQLFQSMVEHGIFVDYKLVVLPEDLYGSVHNWVLLIATEYGLIVLVLYIYAIYQTISRGWSLRKTPGGLMAASCAIILATLYLSAFQFGTTGVSIWLLTPITIMFAWIQNEYDLVYSQSSSPGNYNRSRKAQSFVADGLN